MATSGRPRRTPAGTPSADRTPARDEAAELQLGLDLGVGTARDAGGRDEQTPPAPDRPEGADVQPAEAGPDRSASIDLDQVGNGPTHIDRPADDPEAAATHVGDQGRRRAGR